MKQTQTKTINIFRERRRDRTDEGRVPTVSRVLAVGGPAPSAATPVGARGVERVAALIGQIALLPIDTGCPCSTGRSAVAHSDLTELFVNLETFQAQLLHLLQDMGGNDTLGNVLYLYIYL